MLQWRPVNAHKPWKVGAVGAGPGLANVRGMSAAARTVPTEKTLKEYAEALASRGHVKAAADLIDAHLAQHDAGWGLWTTFAQLSRRLGRHELAVAAYRASARQLEAAGHVGHAYLALKAALALTPGDALLRDDVVRLARLRDRNRERPTLHVEPGQRAIRLVPPPPPTPLTVKPIPPPIPARLRAKATGPRPAEPPRPPAARPVPPPRPRPVPVARAAPPTQQLTPKRSLPSVTDPYIAIFDILDDEKRKAQRRAR